MIRTLNKQEWETEREAVKNQLREVQISAMFHADDLEGFVTLCVELGLTAWAGMRLVLRMGMDNAVNLDGMTRAYIRAVTGRGGKFEGDDDDPPW